MGVVSDLVKHINIPEMLTVKQTFDDVQIQDIAGEVRKQIRQEKIMSQIRPGMKIAVGAGSRGISNYAAIVKETVNCLKELGAEPFIVAAMGSHGGASAKGQRQILAGYGITEEEMGCPLKISTETAVIGQTEEGHPVHIDKFASEADGIVVINRIKPHTAFRGPFESGLMKMLAIGIAKQKGAEFCHARGFKHMAHMVPLFGTAIIKHSNIMFGIAILENAYDQTREIVALRGDEFETCETELLKRAKSYMPRILIENADLLIVDEIGKNISGDGMDPNISGTFATPYADGGIKTQRVAVLDISEESHGNGVGWGMADCSTKRAFDKFDMEMSYPNSLTCLVTGVIKIPMILKNDRECIQAAIKTCADIDYEKPTVVRIKNTLCMAEIQVSANLRDQVLSTEGMEIIREAQPLLFDEEGNLR